MGARRRHANPAIGAFGGAPYGATRLVRGVPTWACGRQREEEREEGGGGGGGGGSGRRGPMLIPNADPTPQDVSDIMLFMNLASRASSQGLQDGRRGIFPG
eukprot:9480762-Pyramimonas_sp.AAC.1